MGENYSNVGSVVSGTQFIPFKVPLSSKLLRLVSDGVAKWGIDELMEAVPRLGLVVDLTNTTRYYDSKKLQDMGVRYCKIFTKGHEVPSKDVVAQFYEAVDMLDDDKLVGVHCTHGLNRTGYLICRYMVERKGFDPEDAIAAFDASRGHKQERENYLQHLRQKTWESEIRNESEKKDDQTNRDENTLTKRNDEFNRYDSKRKRKRGNRFRQNHNSSYSGRNYGGMDFGSSNMHGNWSRPEQNSYEEYYHQDSYQCDTYYNHPTSSGASTDMRDNYPNSRYYRDNYNQWWQGGNHSRIGEHSNDYPQSFGRQRGRNPYSWNQGEYRTHRYNTDNADTVRDRVSDRSRVTTRGSYSRDFHHSETDSHVRNYENQEYVPNNSTRGSSNKRKFGNKGKRKKKSYIQTEGIFS